MKTTRFVAVDQTRGLAICAMILAHFGPGIYERLGIQGVLLDSLLLIGRFATPTFIAVFGFSLAFAYFPAATQDWAGTRTKMLRRSRTVLAAAILVSTPSMFLTLGGREGAAQPLAFSLGLDLYGVLFFYFIAISVTALIIPHLARAKLVAPALTGAALIFSGTWLGYDSWPYGGENILELLRLYFVSGQYAVLVNLGMAFLMAAFGWHLRELHVQGVRLGPVLLFTGIVLLLCGLSLGRIVGWRTLAQLHSDFSAPPQLWFLMLICGAMLVAMSVFDTIKIPAASFFLEHTGRNPLTIYVAHAFVLPGVAMLRTLFPNLPDGIAIALPLTLFMVFWVTVVVRSSHQQSASSRHESGPQRSRTV